MDALTLNRLSLPIITGSPQTRTPGAAGAANGQSGERSFQQILQGALEQRANVSFSKHAVTRVVERNIDISPESLERLGQGVRIAQEKGLDDTLILVDSTAFIVSAKNNKVITTVSGSDLAGNVFTNIDGTVVI